MNLKIYFFILSLIYLFREKIMLIYLIVFFIIRYEYFVIVDVFVNKIDLFYIYRFFRIRKWKILIDENSRVVWFFLRF